MKKKVQKKKTIAAFLLALLTLSGGALALPIIDKMPSDDLVYINTKQLQNNPMQFLKIENFELTDDFDYFRELNNEYVKDYNPKITERDLMKSLEEGDYEEWKNEFEEMGGKGTISKEEFDILREIKLKKDSYN